MNMKNKFSFISGVVLLVASFVLGISSGLAGFLPLIGLVILIIPIILIICGFSTKGIILPVILIAVELYFYFMYLPTFNFLYI